MPPRETRLGLTTTLLGWTVVAMVSALLLVACGPRADSRVTRFAVAETPGAVEPRNTNPSPGCTAAEAAPPTERFVVHGQERTVLARVPEGPRTVPRDLVIAFHGRTNDARQVRRYFHLDEALPEAVIVYPRALAATSDTFSWSAPGDPPDRLRDFALVEGIIDVFGRTLCIDLERVFVVGHSLGASFANDVACRLGGRIRAVASIAGALQGGPCVGGAAAMLLHHPDDRLVPVSAGERARDAFLAANGLAGAPAVPAGGSALAALRCVRHGGDAEANPVVWCPHDDATGPGGRYYPHTWPDGAAAAIAAFFRGLP